MGNADINRSKLPLRKTPDLTARPTQAQEGVSVPTFEDIYREHAERTLNLLYRFTSREQVARDLLQDVFIKVYENMDSFEKRSQIFTWIYRIAVNHAINHVRRERRTLWFNLLDESVGDLLKREKVEISGLGGGDVPRPDELLERSEADQFVQRAVDALPVKYRIPFVLFKDEHMSYNEISEVLDLSMSAVESRIHRARKMLIKKLSPLLK
jgi:RNA polymerase sigma-70 factor (ECF subfamily)